MNKSEVIEIVIKILFLNKVELTLN